MLLQVASVAAAGPGLTVVTPVDKAVVNTGSVTVEFKATDFSIVPSSVPISEFGKRPDLNHPGEGHVHLTLDLQPLVVWYSADRYTFTNVPPGDHPLMVELVNNDHSSLSTRVMRMIQFRVVQPQTLPKTGSAAGGQSAAILASLIVAIVLIAAGRLTLRNLRS